MSQDGRAGEVAGCSHIIVACAALRHGCLLYLRLGDRLPGRGLLALASPAILLLRPGALCR